MKSRRFIANRPRVSVSLGKVRHKSKLRTPNGAMGHNNGLVRCKKSASLFDDLVGGCEQRWRHCEAEHLGGFEVDDK